ncbi:MAG: hypothetical protein GY789_05055 [Hyphomicrobiales bacterium]|nr:hypothetical protein [Hyphomicrobiales bacterium]MCP4997670.1 hypothetical protein [Hyphomicrobiales bacterium]
MDVTPTRQNTPHEPDQQRRSTTIVLFVLAILFCMRVAGQLIQAIWTVPVIPPFSSWQSGALPYNILLISQIVIIALMVLSIRAVTTGKIFARLGSVLSILGVVYFALMTLRSLIGFFELATSPWFDQPLPIAFHFVLAGYTLVLGWYWTAPIAGQTSWHQLPAKVAPLLAYPLTILFACACSVGSSLTVSAWLCLVWMAPAWQDFFDMIGSLSDAVLCPAFLCGARGRWP